MVPYHYYLLVEYKYRSLNGTKSRKEKKYGVMVKDSGQIGQLSKLCLIDFFFSCVSLFLGPVSCSGERNSVLL